jgi:hypothetical protein
VDNAPIDIAQARPDVWVALASDQPEGGFVIRRFERWTCTCGIGEEPCRHVRAARSLLAKAVTPGGSAENPRDALNLGDADVTTRKRSRRKARGASDDAADASQTDDGASGAHEASDGPLLIMPRKRLPRPVKVTDRSATRITDSEVAA